MEGQVLAFDFGASSGRAMLGRYDGKTIIQEEIHRFPNEPVNVAGTLYWDVLRLFHEIKQGLTKASKKSFISVGIDTWGVDFGLLDKRGKPTTGTPARTEWRKKARKLFPPRICIP